MNEEPNNLECLRDHFAGQAIPALLANEPNPWIVARRAYEIADAMLEVRGDGEQ